MVILSCLEGHAEERGNIWYKQDVDYVASFTQNPDQSKATREAWYKVEEEKRDREGWRKTYHF